MAGCPVCGFKEETMYGQCQRCGLDMSWNRWRIEGEVMAVAGVILMASGLVIYALGDNLLSQVLLGPGIAAFAIGAPFYLYYQRKISALARSWKLKVGRVL